MQAQNAAGAASDYDQAFAGALDRELKRMQQLSVDDEPRSADDLGTTPSSGMKTDDDDQAWDEELARESERMQRFSMDDESRSADDLGSTAQSDTDSEDDESDDEESDDDESDQMPARFQFQPMKRYFSANNASQLTSFHNDIPPVHERDGGATNDVSMVPTASSEPSSDTTGSSRGGEPEQPIHDRPKKRVRVQSTEQVAAIECAAEEVERQKEADDYKRDKKGPKGELEDFRVLRTFVDWVRWKGALERKAKKISRRSS